MRRVGGPRSGDAGFGLIEAVVALMLLAVIIVPITRVVITTLNSDNYLHLKAEAADVATSALESAQYQTSTGILPQQGTTTTTQYSGKDAFQVALTYALVAGTSTSSNLCTSGGGAVTSQIWQVNATVTWGTANDRGTVAETTLISPNTPDLANLNLAELAVPVFNADDSSLESTTPVTLTAVGQCNLTSGTNPCGTVPSGAVTTETASTNLIGCAVFPNLYAGTGETYSITATPNTISTGSNLVDPSELLGTPSINGGATVTLQSGIAVSPNSVSIANSPNVIIAQGVPTTFQFQTVAFSGTGSTTTTTGASTTSTTSGSTTTTTSGSTTTTAAAAMAPTKITVTTNCTSGCTRSLRWTANVTVIAPGSGPPTGTVTFVLSNGLQGSLTTCGSNGVVTLPPSGTATCNFTPRSGSSPGAVTATYSGDSNFYGSTAAIYQTRTTSVTDSYLSLSPSADPSTTGTSVTFTAAMTSSGGGTPTGTVAFTNGGTTIAGCSAVAVTSGGTATCPSTFASTCTCTCTYTIAAAYTGSGSKNDQSSSASITQVVAGSSTTTTTGATTTTTSATTTTTGATTTTTSASTTTTTSPNAGGVLPAAYLPISINSGTLLCNSLGAGTCVLGNGTSAGGFSSVTPQTAVLFPGPSTTPDYTAWVGDQADSEPFWVDSGGVAIYGSTAATSFTASATTTSANVTLPVWPLSLTVTTKSGVTLTGLTVTDAGGGDNIALNAVSGGKSATGLPLGQFLVGAVVSSGASTVTLTAGGTSTLNTAPVYVWILPNGVCTSSSIQTTPCSSPSTSAITVQVG